MVDLGGGGGGGGGNPPYFYGEAGKFFSREGLRQISGSGMSGPPLIVRSGFASVFVISVNRNG